MARDSAANGDLPVPQDCQARAEGIAKPLETIDKPGQEQKMETCSTCEGKGVYDSYDGDGRAFEFECYACHGTGKLARPTADLGEDGELVARLRAASKGFVQATPGGYYGLCAEAADRLILYREARDVLAELTDMLEQAFPALTHSPLLVRVRDILSRSA